MGREVCSAWMLCANFGGTDSVPAGMWEEPVWASSFDAWIPSLQTSVGALRQPPTSLAGANLMVYEIDSWDPISGLDSLLMSSSSALFIVG
jgi:hypothetical protein